MEFSLTQEILDTIDRYIKGELKGEELSAFEIELNENVRLKEEMLIQKQLFDALKNKSESLDSLSDLEVNILQEKINSLAYQNISKKIKLIGNEYAQNPVLDKKPLWVRFRRLIPAAAAALILIVLSTVFIFDNNTSLDQYYYDNVDWNTELTSFAEKGDAKSEMARAEELFNTKEYEKAIEAFKNISPDDELHPYSLMYIGAAHANLDQDQLALDAFNKLAAMEEFGESSKGLWYAALIQLKREDKEESLAILEEITKDSSNYRYREAVEIIGELEKM